MIFKFFSSHNIAVLESNYRLIKAEDGFNIGRVVIYANISIEKESTIVAITKKIRSIGQVFKLEKIKESGEFCY